MPVGDSPLRQENEDAVEEWVDNYKKPYPHSYDTDFQGW